MFGLVVLVVMVLYLWLLVWATRRGWRWGIEKKGWIGRKRWMGAAIGFLIVYLPVFWDFLPTVAVHQYYCAKESGFWVYKTLDQWKAENPGVAETLVADKSAPSTREGGMQNYVDTYFLNQRFNWIVKKNGPHIFNRWMWEKEVVDTKTNEVMARYVDFSTGSGFISGAPRIVKFWLQKDHCMSGENNMYAMDALVGNMSQSLKKDNK
jgi:hypothetical protein